MSPELADSDPRKWIYSHHTGAKHSILERYLGAWFAILGAVHRGRTYPRLIVLDGFAGRGRYRDGELGSPRIIHARAVSAIERGIASNVALLCGDADPSNFEELGRVMGEVSHERVDVRVRCRPFAESAVILRRYLERQSIVPPTFVFADPFGFAGVPLDADECRRGVAPPHARAVADDS